MKTRKTIYAGEDTVTHSDRRVVATSATIETRSGDRAMLVCLVDAGKHPEDIRDSLEALVHIMTDREHPMHSEIDLTSVIEVMRMDASDPTVDGARNTLYRSGK